MLAFHLWDGSHVVEVVAFGSAISERLLKLEPGEKIRLIGAELGWRAGLVQLRIDVRKTRLNCPDFLSHERVFWGRHQCPSYACAIAKSGTRFCWSIQSPLRKSGQYMESLPSPLATESRALCDAQIPILYVGRAVEEAICKTLKESPALIVSSAQQTFMLRRRWTPREPDRN